MSPTIVDIRVGIPEHVGETKEILVCIMLAGDVHVVGIAEVRSEETIRCHWLVVNGGVDIVKSPVPTLNKSRLLSCIEKPLRAFVLTMRPVLQRQGSHSAENAVVHLCVASVCFVEIAVEFWRVQQALQHSVAVALVTRVEQAFGLVHTPGLSSKRPAFADATIDYISKVSSSARCRHGCIGVGLIH